MNVYLNQIVLNLVDLQTVYKAVSIQQDVQAQ